MDALKIDDERDFVTRQYASLVASGLNDAAARTRLGDVLGKAALALLDTRDDSSDARHTGAAHLTARLLETAKRLGGKPAETQAALINSLTEARLFALDWWRPVRTFLLYILFLLGLAITVAIIYAVWVLPAFSHLDHALAVPGGAAGWIMTKGALRLFAPLVVMAILLGLLATLWFRMRTRMARLEPLTGQSRFPWLYGASGTAYQTLACLEYATALKAGGVADAEVLEPALRLAGWPAGKPFQVRGLRLSEGLQQAERLGTFAAELEWQRRLHWSRAQAQLELSRDRLTLFSRVVFYILIGIMVTVLYIPIFTVASMFGVH
jgi:hypothetical protein